MSAELRPATDFDLPTLADVFSRGFEGYFVPIHVQTEDLAQRLVHDSIDLARSRVAVQGDRPVGVVFVGVRGWSGRIAATGVVTEARRQGLGRRLMDAVIDDARTVGLRRLVLEVIEQNDPAVALYRGLGFEAWRRLVGYERAADTSTHDERADTDAASLASIDPREVARQIAAEADPDLPWQLAAETYAGRGTGLVGHQLGEQAFALTHDPGDGPMVLEALLVPRAARRAGRGGRLFRALARRHAGRDWRIPGRVPEDLAAPFLDRLGFRRDDLSQLEMVLTL